MRLQTIQNYMFACLDPFAPFGKFKYSSAPAPGLVSKKFDLKWVPIKLYKFTNSYGFHGVKTNEIFRFYKC